MKQQQAIAPQEYATKAKKDFVQREGKTTDNTRAANPPNR